MQQKVALLRSNLEQRLTQAILMSQSPQSAPLKIAQSIAETFQAQGCVILSQPGSVTQISSWFKPELASSRVVQNLLVQWVANPPDCLTTGSWVADCAPAASTSAEEPIGLLVYWVPTQLQGQVNGAIGLVRSQFQEWDESAVHLLESLSPQVTIAISQAQLGQQLQQQAQYQVLIDQLTTAIRNAWDLEDIFNLAVEGTASSLQVNRGLLLLFKYADPLHKSRNLEGIPKAQATIAAHWLNSESSASVANLTFSASECCICQQVLRSAEPIVVPVGDVLNSSSHSTSSERMVSLLGLAPSHAVLLMPLENQGTVLGCLVLHQEQSRLWSAEELSFVKLVAAQLSTAIIQTRTLKQIQGVVQERTVQLQRSLEVQAKLYEKTRQQVEQLRKLNAEREEFLSTVSHELRTPLTSMMLAIRMLQQADLAPDRQKKYLDILEQQCIQETKLINDLLALRKLETNSASNQLQKIDLRYLLESAAQSVKASWAEKGLILTLALPSHPVTLFTDPDSLNRILLELLANARKYASSESTIELELKANPPRKQVLISVRNVGDGILPEELPHIFEKFRRGQGVTKRAIQGTGLGLALVKGLVEHLNGTIAVSSQPCPVPDSDCWETCFTLTLPQCPEGAIALVSS
ncbi:GAF domain-containing protein [Phormidium tenue FACHB-886]|nr:GAF domain-containing protein [Phormidium tenue FACHB-886]